MEIGSSITLMFNENPHSKELEAYRCKVIDIDEKYVYVDEPIHLKTNKVQFIKEKVSLKILFVRDGVANEFTSVIAKRVKLTVPALAITLPEKEKINRVQRREFVRVKTAADVAIHFPNRSLPPLISVTDDISGGGASVIVPPDIQINKKQVVELYLVLQSISVDYVYLKIKAEIIRFHVIDNIHTVSLKFLLDSIRDQQKIIKYCFDVQREKRKQEIL